MGETCLSTKENYLWGKGGYCGWHMRESEKGSLEEKISILRQVYLPFKHGFGLAFWLFFPGHKRMNFTMCLTPVWILEAKKESCRRKKLKCPFVNWEKTNVCKKKLAYLWSRIKSISLLWGCKWPKFHLSGGREGGSKKSLPLLMLLRVRTSKDEFEVLECQSCTFNSRLLL